MRILFAGDTPLVREAVSDSLASMGYDHIVVNSGEEILKWLNKPDEKFDLVITDQNMGSGMTGLEVVRSLRADVRYEALPIVVYTSDERLKLEIERAGGIFASKTVALDGVLRDIERSLKR